MDKTYRISIVTFFSKEVPLVIDACEFSPIRKELELELICPSEDALKYKTDNLQLTGLNNINKLPVPTPQQICFFASPASFDYYCKQENINSSYLYVHPDMAVLELKGNNPFHTDLAEYGLCPCVLKEDTAEDLYEKKEKLIYFSDLSQFIENKKHNYVLLSTNFRFIEALINIDRENWELFHPELNYRNLRVNIGKPHSILLNAQKQLLNMARPLDDIYDLAGIRFCRRNNSSAYSFFAEHYDDYMAHVDYALWVNSILYWFKQYSPLKLSKILELACGTANMSIQFVRKGYTVFACDNSVDMLKIAARKTVKPKLYYASLTDPILGKDYQLVICMFDSINYLTQTKQIAKVLQEVSLALETGGLFIFDISTLENSMDNFAHLCDLHRYSDGLMIHQAYFEYIQLIQKSSLHFFKKNILGYSYQFEQHQQRVYYTYELIEIIRNSPLKLIAIHSTETKTNLYPKHLSTIDDKFSRLFFVLQKV